MVVYPGMVAADHENGGQNVQYLRFGVRILHKQSVLMSTGALSLGVALCSAIYSVEQSVIAQGKDNSVYNYSQNVLLLEAGKSVER
jgi:hypothetical protein